MLRLPEPADADAIFAGYAQDKVVTRHLSWRPHGSAAETRAFLGSLPATRERGEAFAYVIARPADRQPLGMIEMRPTEHGMLFGYVLARRHWGHGLAAEALTALVEWSLEQPSVHRAWAFCDAENPASARVMAKAGMSFEGMLRRWAIFPNLDPDPRNCLVYAKIR
jgi:ribosomal-protein-alanine N-acetyltransferase